MNDITDYSSIAKQFTEITYEDLSEIDKYKMVEIGQKVLAEDKTLNVFLLYKYDDCRKQLFEMVAKSAIYFAELSPTDQKIKRLINSLNKHFDNMVIDMVKSTNIKTLSDFLDLIRFNESIPEDKRQGLLRELIMTGIFDDSNKLTEKGGD